MCLNDIYLLRVATFLEKAAHSVIRMFSLLCLFLALLISHFRFESRALVLIVSVPGHCLPFNFLTSIVPLY